MADRHQRGLLDGVLGEGGEPLPYLDELKEIVERDDVLLNKLAVIFPVNNNTDMRFYQNTWLRKYLYPVCDWPGEGCRIVCNETSTYRYLDRKTFCFTRAVKQMDKEFYLKLDDDAFVDRDYVVRLIRKFTGWKRPVYISDHRRYHDKKNPGVLDHILYGNGKFYMFNRPLAQCANVDLKYNGKRRNEDAVFGGMVSTGCGEKNVEYVKEDDDWIWHKTYSHLNKFIDLAYIKNH
ncbi:hypothetical protein GGF46_004032 [Coemansia sp. RSA 552]|nr:hypothetical protein GGF46_004032 [Coemansia sp. RSA 552]